MRPFASLLALALVIVALCTCGGASSTGDFSLDIPGSATVMAGGDKVLTVIIRSEGGFDGTITWTVSGVPAGVTISSSPGGNGRLPEASGRYMMTISASPDTALGTYTITFQATSGHLQHSATMQLQVTEWQQADKQKHPPLRHLQGWVPAARWERSS
jgi:hypothetical protein